MWIHPPVALQRAGTDKQGPWRAQRDEMLRIHWQVPCRQGSGVLQEIARHPVVLICRRQVLHTFAEIATQEFCASGT